jgi:hypothetical protein
MARSTQRTIFDRGQRSASPPAAASAAARCVAAQWLIVTNVEPPPGSGERRGVAFHALPPLLPAEIVGYEFVQIDGVAISPREMRC